MVRALLSTLMVLVFALAVSACANNSGYPKCSQDSECKSGEKCEANFCVKRPE